MPSTFQPRGFAAVEFDSRDDGEMKGLNNSFEFERVLESDEQASVRAAVRTHIHLMVFILCRSVLISNLRITGRVLDASTTHGIMSLSVCGGIEACNYSMNPSAFHTGTSSSNSQRTWCSWLASACFPPFISLLYQPRHPHGHSAHPFADCEKKQ